MKYVLYFFKVFPRFLPIFSPISLKLFQKNFLKFFHNININFKLRTLIFPNDVSIIFLESFKIFFLISFKFSQNFLAISAKYLQNLYELIPNFKFMQYFPQVILKFIRNHQKISFLFVTLLIFFINSLQLFLGFLGISLKIFKNIPANSPKYF